MIKEKSGLTDEEGKLMAKVARRSHQVDAVYTWEKFQAMGYMWVMIPVINAMYDNEGRPYCRDINATMNYLIRIR